MKRAFKTEIKLAEAGRIKLHQTLGVCRFLYNKFLSYNQQRYRESLEGKQPYGFVSGMDFDQYVNNELSKQEGYEWIKDVGSKARKKAIMNADTAFQRFFKGESDFPRFKKKKNQDVKAYFPKNNKGDWTVERHRIKIPTFGWVRLKEFGYIPTTMKVTSGTVSKKAGRYFVSVLCELENVPQQPKLMSEKGKGIDLGIKTFAVCSDNQEFKNVNKTPRVKKLTKKLKREQRSLSRKYESVKKSKMKGGESATKTRANVDKNICRVQRLHQRLADIRLEYVKSVVTSVVKTKPRYITIEDLNVKGMMKNRHLSKAIAEQCFYTFKKWLINKCVQRGIELREVSLWYPSSKLCSCCGQLKNDLTLKDRTYECNCGNKMDRDLNAAVNLMHAKEYTLLT
ncbi:transposase [Bacillaceae bacterium IKA-2]|nr:transposase [Bacillaceae bacterium IKA-2]